MSKQNLKDEPLSIQQFAKGILDIELTDEQVRMASHIIKGGDVSLSNRSGKTAMFNFINKMLSKKLTVSEFAELKNCSRQTIYQNKDKLTWITVPGAKVQKILLDKKALDFKPDIRKVNKKYK
jgi:hypothetical protein